MNFCNSSGTSALLYAAMENHDECVEMLTHAGADMNVCDKDSHKAFGGNKPCLHLLLQTGAKNDKDFALWTKAKCGNSKGMELLIAAGADVNTVGEEQKMGLAVAANYGHSQCVKLLINAGADLDKKDVFGYTALYCASMKGHAQCVDLLLTAGADVNVTDTKGNTILMAAAATGSEQCVKRILKAGAYVNKSNDMNQNAFMNFFAYHSSRNLAMLLFAAGEEIDGTTIEVEPWHRGIISMEVPEYIQNKQLQMCLKHLCRETIREHLIMLDRYSHLFDRIPRLGLPSSLTQYLLYYCSL